MNAGATTVGVDLAAQPATTALAVLEWAPGGATVRSVRVDVTDDGIIERCDGADKIGIDCPFGWPLAFVAFVDAHTAGQPVAPASGIEQRRPLAYRATDLWCRTEFGMQPLSVSADRIAHGAFRCAGLLARLDPRVPPDRSGAGRLVETYPAGSLRRWGGFDAHGYKGVAGRQKRADNVDRLRSRLSLHFDDPDHERLMTTSDHAFDAVVAAITARVAMLGLVAPVPDEHAHAARVEGWITVPDPDSLDHLRHHPR